MTISAIILAAGQSVRMGDDNKLLLPFRDSTIIENTVDQVTGSNVGETIVVLGHEAERVRPLLEGKPVTVVENSDYREGMGSSLKAGLARVSKSATGVMICLTDLPLVESEDLNRLLGEFEAGSEETIVVPFHEGQRGNPVLFSAIYRDEVMQTRGPVGGCRGIVKRYPERVVAVAMETDHVVYDVDTPEDYARLIGRQ